jgi:hypothetical protein
MTLNLPLSSETEAKIRAYAAIAGQDLENFVLQAVNEKLADVDSEPMVSPQRGDDWAKKLQACMDLHPIVSHFVDDSRASIYAGRGE